MQEKWKSKVLWAAVAAQVISILLLTNAISVAQGDLANQVIGGVLQLLVLLGVLNNPNSADKL